MQVVGQRLADKRKLDHLAVAARQAESSIPSRQDALEYQATNIADPLMAPTVDALAVEEDT